MKNSRNKFVNFNNNFEHELMFGTAANI